MMRPPNVGCPKTVRDARCQANKTANAFSHEEKGTPVPNEPVQSRIEILSRDVAAKLMAGEVAKLLNAHPSIVYRMAGRGELLSFKIGSAWRFDRAKIDEWVGSRSEGPKP
jgi:excisionase family DNA binding protein